MNAASDTIELMRAAVRPIMIISGWFVVIFMVANGIEPPEWLRYTVISFSGEYIIERGVKHWRDKGAKNI